MLVAPSRAVTGNGSTPVSMVLLTLLTLVLSTTPFGAVALPAWTGFHHVGHPASSGIAYDAGSVPPARSRPDVQPAAGFTLRADGLTPTAVSLGWNQSTSFLFNSYTVAYSNTSAGGPFTTAGVITTKATTQFAFGSLSPGSTTWWEVTESHFGGTSTSNVLAVTQPTLAYLTAFLVSSTAVELNWTDNATYGGLVSFNAFVILQKNSSAGAFVAVKTISIATARSDNVTGLSVGGSYAFYLRTSDCLGCGSAGANTTATASNAVGVGTPFPLGASVAATRTVVDVGESDLFLCTASGGQTPYFYNWSVNGSGFAPGSSSLALAFSTVGPVPVRCQATDSLGAQNRVGTSVTVNAALVVTASVNRTHADAGEPVSFACTVSGGTPATPLAWVFGDGSGLSGGSAVHAFAANGTYAATCSTTDGAGVTATVTENLSISPPLAVGVQESATEAAPGTLLAFSAAVVNGSGNYTSYVWTFGDRASAAGVSVAHAYNGTGTFSVEVRVTDSNGIAVHGSSSITVSWVTVQLTSEPASGSAGVALAFSASASGGAGAPYNYTWSFGDGTTGFGASVGHAYSSAGVYSPSVTVRDRLGGENVTFSPKVTVGAAPTALSWLPVWALLVTSALVGAALTALLLARPRPQDEPSAEALSRWVPPFGPKGAVHGAKRCPSCGAANPTLRRSCKVCGATLPRE